MPVLPTPSFAATLSLALLGASCSVTTDLSGLQRGAGGGSSSPAVCGDGIIQAGEECDDGNSHSSDGCADCVVECDGAGETKDPETLHCYWYDGATIAAFNKATARCADWRSNGTLATITTDPELSFIKYTIGVEINTWIGATVTTAGEYRWVTGEPWGVSDWQEHYPDDSNGFASCVALGDKNLQWVNTPCPTERIVLCESSPLGEPAP